MAETIADKIILFNSTVDFKGKLPNGISIMNPFKESKTALSISNEFYRKFYSDDNKRTLILGINPGRLGAGVTGIPFTDTKRLEEYCDMSFPDLHSHEPSSVFIYDMINSYGGPRAFYNRFYINSVCPLGFVIQKANGKSVNYNYYDTKELQSKVEPFIIKNIKHQIDIGMNTQECFILGTGKNYSYFSKLNEKHTFFEKVTALEHPRYVIQYKSKFKGTYIDKYIKLLDQNRSDDR